MKTTLFDSVVNRVESELSPRSRRNELIGKAVVKGAETPKSINIRGKYLVALLHAYPRTRDNARRTNESSPRMYVTDALEPRAYERDTAGRPWFGKPVGVIPLPNYSARPPIMRPQCWPT
ncbi:hypothetical protein K0M31_010833, partial [Melipona bicolor]